MLYNVAMKTCPKCLIEKSESEFHKDRARSDGLFAICKTCVSVKGKERYYSMTHEQRLAYNSRQKDRYHGILHPRKLADERGLYRERKQRITDIKSSHGCLRCGEIDASCLDFHHVGEKSFEISNGKKISESRLGKEISKCVVLCSNCHRKLHAELWSLLDFSAKIESDYPEAFDMLYKSVHPYH